MTARLRRSAWCVCICLLVALSHAQEKPTWTANPSYVYQHDSKYPNSVTVRLYLNTCKYDPTTGQILPNQLGAGPFTVKITGVQINPSTPTVGDCSLTTTLDMSNAQPGIESLSVTNNGKDAGFATIALMDATAGPTPNGPEVDVLWEVMTDHICKDNFGNHMPSDLYCIDVKIGNNTGHALQLAGLGFQRKSLQCMDSNKKLHPCTLDGENISTPNVGYQMVRASAQNSAFFTGHNLFVNGMQAVGLLMASFTPFFENSFNKSRWSTGAAIVGTAVPQATNLVSPDLTVRELNNLDDQAFREGKTIPNNTQVRLLVFVQKKSVAEAIMETVPEIKDGTSIDCKDSVPDGYKKRSDKPGMCYPAWENSFKGCLKTLDCSPVVVKLALGRLIIIGDKIDYIQRIVVDSSVLSQQTPTPLAPQTASLAAGPLSGTVTGAGLQDVSKVNVSCPNSADPSKAVNADITTGITASANSVTFSAGGTTVQPNASCVVTVTNKAGQSLAVQTVTPKQ